MSEFEWNNETQDNEIESDNTVFPDEISAQEGTTRKKARKGLIITISIIGVLLISIITAIIVFMSKPSIRLVRALDKTLFDSESIDFDATIGFEIEDGPELEVNGNMDFGEDIEDSSFSFNAIDQYGRTEMLASLSDEIITIDNKSYRLKPFLREVEDELRYEGMSFDIEDMLNRVIDEKLDRNELIEVYIEEIAPELKKWDSHGIPVNTADIDFVTFFKDFIKHSYKEMPDDIIVFEKAKSKNGSKYEYVFDLNEWYDFFWDFAEDREEMNDLVDAIAEGYDVPTQLVEYQLSQYFYYTSTIEGEFTIESGRLTEFSFYFYDIYGDCEFFTELSIDSE